MLDMPNFSDLIGKKFRYSAVGPNEYDCYSLCQEVCKRVGMTIPNQEDLAEKQAPLPDFDLVKAESADYSKIVNKCIDVFTHTWFKKLDGPEPFSIIVFNHGPHFAGHLGVVLDRNKFIHIYPKRNCCIEKLDHPLWNKKIEGFYRYVGQPN